MRVLNIKKGPKGPAEDDIDELRRLVSEALRDPDGFIVVHATIEIDADGNVILRKN